MKYPCNTIKDLLPLYHDEVCSDESREIVEGHLLECEGCRAYYEMMKESSKMFKEMSIDEKADFRMIKKIKKKFQRSRIMTAIISLGLGIALVLGFFKFMNSYIVPIEYNKENFRVAEENGQLYAYIIGDLIHSFNKKVITDGNENNLYFYMDTTAAQKYLVPDSDETKKYSLEYVETILNEGQTSDTIDNVYYLIANYSKLEDLSANELNEVIDNGILLWSKNKMK